VVNEPVDDKPVNVDCVARWVEESGNWPLDDKNCERKKTYQIETDGKGTGLQCEAEHDDEKLFQCVDIKPDTPESVQLGCGCWDECKLQLGCGCHDVECKSMKGCGVCSGHGMCTFSVCTYGRCQGHKCTCLAPCGICTGTCYLSLTCGCHGTCCTSKKNCEICRGHGMCTLLQNCGCHGTCTGHTQLLSCGICYGTLGSTCQVVQPCGCAGHYCIPVTCPARKEDPCPGGSMWFGYCMQSYATKQCLKDPKCNLTDPKTKTIEQIGMF